MANDEDILTQAYQAFNARDIDAILALMHPDVAWANGMEGGYVHGHAAVRDYWTRQWQMIDPHVEPQGMTRDATGQIHVVVHQVVRDLAGTLLGDRLVKHVYHMENGLVQRLEIHEA